MSKLIYKLAKHTCFLSLIYAQQKSRAEQKEQVSNAEKIHVRELQGDKAEVHTCGANHIVTYMHKVKHAGNELNKKKIHREQYLYTGMCPRWLVMHGERIPCAWGVTVTLCCVWELRGLCAMSQQGLVSVTGCNTVRY